MKRRILANYDATKEPIVRHIENAAKQIIRNRCESRFDLDTDDVACDIAYMSRVECHPYVSGGASFTAYPGGRYKQVTLNGSIPKPNKVFSNPEKWAQFIIHELDRQVGGDVVDFWYKKMRSQVDIHDEIQRMQIESSTNEKSKMKKFTKNLSNTVNASTADTFYTTIEQARFAMEDVCKGLIDLDEFSDLITNDEMDILSEAYQILDTLTRRSTVQ